MKMKFTKTAIFLFFLSAFILQFSAGSYAAKKTPRREALRIYAFGDSITHGVNASTINTQTFRYILSQKLSEKYGIDVRVYDGGIGGQDTQMADKRFSDVTGADPDIAIIMFGSNDAALKDGYGEERSAPRVAIEKYRATIEKWIDALQEKGTAVILMTPPPTTGNYQDLGDGKSLSRDQKSVTKNYAKACREIAVLKKTDLVDNFQIILEAVSGKSPAQLFISDGIHLNPKGNAAVANNIIASAFESEKSLLMRNPRTAPFFASKPEPEKTPAPGPSHAADEEVSSAKDDNEEIEATVESFPAVDYSAIEKNNLVNLALGKTYIESSPDRKCARNVLTDGVANVKNADKAYFTAPSEVFPKWVTIDLGKLSDIRHLVIYNSGRAQTRKIKIFGSDDLESFRQIGKYAFRRDEPNYHLALAKPEKARYVKIEFSDSFGESRSVSLNEVEIWGKK